MTSFRYDKRFYNLRTEYEKRMNLTKLAAVKNKQNKSDYGKWTFIVSMFFAIVLIQQAIFEKTVHILFQIMTFELPNQNHDQLMNSLISPYLYFLPFSDF